MALPGDSQIEMDVVVYPHGPTYPDPGWRFPDGAVLVKTFSLPDRRLETRILQHRKMPGNDDEYGAQYWYGYTYLWNDEQTDAELLGPAGLDREYSVKDDLAPGGTRFVKWHFPSRAECTLCHTMAAKYILGVTTLQMNKDHDYSGVIANHHRQYADADQQQGPERERIEAVRSRGRMPDPQAREQRRQA